MNFYDITFFCNKGEEDNKKEGPVVSLEYTASIDPWPVTIRINTSGLHHQTPVITFYMSELQLIQFKNSIISSYEKYLKEKTNG